jgi:hypothetical protein
VEEVADEREILGWLEFAEAARHLAADVLHAKSIAVPWSSQPPVTAETV